MSEQPRLGSKTGTAPNAYIQPRHAAILHGTYVVERENGAAALRRGANVSGQQGVLNLENIDGLPQYDRA